MDPGCGRVVSFPHRYLYKLIGIVAGVSALLGLNTLRISSLVWIGAYRPTWFPTAHELVWPAVLTCCAMLLWVGWATRISDAPIHEVA